MSASNTMGSEGKGREVHVLIESEERRVRCGDGGEVGVKHACRQICPVEISTFLARNIFGAKHDVGRHALARARFGKDPVHVSMSLARSMTYVGQQANPVRALDPG